MSQPQPNSQSLAPQQPTLDPAKLEKLSLVERELADLMAKKKLLDKQLTSIAANIYSYEGSYLEDPAGNIVKGYDGYVHSLGGGRASSSLALDSARGSTNRKVKVAEADRIFSQSSVTYQKSLETKNKELS
ncbi:hypothetical protein HDU82_002178 [Entophlyctis luteolus]|nr:hypothetical protein HDU82_002178 [Entophlyctis luteolus]